MTTRYLRHIVPFSEHPAWVKTSVHVCRLIVNVSQIEEIALPEFAQNHACASRDSQGDLQTNPAVTSPAPNRPITTRFANDNQLFRKTNTKTPVKQRENKATTRTLHQTLSINICQTPLRGLSPHVNMY